MIKNSFLTLAALVCSTTFANASDNCEAGGVYSPRTVRAAGRAVTQTMCPRCDSVYTSEMALEGRTYSMVHNCSRDNREKEYHHDELIRKEMAEEAQKAYRSSLYGHKPGCFTSDQMNPYMLDSRYDLTTEQLKQLESEIMEPKVTVLRLRPLTESLFLDLNLNELPLVMLPDATAMAVEPAPESADEEK